MAKAKPPIEGVHDITAALLEDLAKDGTSGKTILAGDLGQNTWGLEIPTVAFQWLIGGSTKLPGQRYIALSGEQKSMKSTLLKEFGCWFQAAGGLYDDIDNEGKTSDTMFDAMSNWRAKQLEAGRHHLAATDSIEEWQNHISLVVKKFQKIGPRPKGQRIPILIGLDSLTGKGLKASQENLQKEGHAEARSFDAAAAANSVTQFIQNLNLRGTTATICIVRHLTEKIGDTAGYGPKKSETGAKRVNYQHSVNLRLAKVETLKMASHPSQLADGPAIQGYRVKISPEASCIGPTIGREVEVDILWQFLVEEDGSRRQVMWYDWHGALGDLLMNMKYDPKKKVSEFERNLLDKAVFFVGSGKKIKCEELGLVDASATELGKAIENNPVVRARVQNFLGIKHYPDIQDAEIEPYAESE